MIEEPPSNVDAVASPSADSEVGPADSSLASLSQEEREMYRQFFLQFRAQVKKILATVSGLARREERLGALIMVHTRAATAFQKNLDALLDSSDGASTKRAISCTKGCNYCCHQSVGAMIVEAIAIAIVIAELHPHLTAQVLAQATLIEGLSYSEHARKRIPCVFLKDGLCRIHDVRPIVCRSYYSLDLRACEGAYAAGLAPGAAAQIPSFGLAATLRAAIVAAVNTACGEQGLQNAAVELTGAVALVLRDPTAVDRWLAGEQVFRPYQI